MVQTMPDVSPTKWHLAHVTWFFEHFVLRPHLPGYLVFDERWHHLFNSYYYTVGPMHARPERGLLSRPTVREIIDFRAHVDEAMQRLLARPTGDPEVTGAHRYAPRPSATNPSRGLRIVVSSAALDAGDTVHLWTTAASQAARRRSTETRSR